MVVETTNEDSVKVSLGLDEGNEPTTDDQTTNQTEHCIEDGSDGKDSRTKEADGERSEKHENSSITLDSLERNRDGPEPNTSESITKVPKSIAPDDSNTNSTESEVMEPTTQIEDKPINPEYQFTESSTESDDESSFHDCTYLDYQSNDVVEANVVEPDIKAAESDIDESEYHSSNESEDSTTESSQVAKEKETTSIKYTLLYLYNVAINWQSKKLDPQSLDGSLKSKNCKTSAAS